MGGRAALASRFNDLDVPKIIHEVYQAVRYVRNTSMEPVSLSRIFRLIMNTK